MSKQKEAKNPLLRFKELSYFVGLSAFGSIVFNTPVTSAEPQKAIDPLTNCPIGENPTFILGFSQLQEIVGDAMGDPLECEHGNFDNQDTIQKTTHGLNYWRAPINQTIFTDGFRHWSNKNGLFLYWEGQDIEPPETAIPVSGPNVEVSPQTLESFITSTKLTDQLLLDPSHQIEIRASSNSAFNLAINPETKNNLLDLMKQNAIDNGYKKIEIVIVNSPTDVPIEWNSQFTTVVNLTYFRGETGTPENYLIGSFRAEEDSNVLYFFYAPSEKLDLTEPAKALAVHNTLALNLFTALIYGGNLNTDSPLLGKNEYLLLASNAFILSPTFQIN